LADKEFIVRKGLVVANTVIVTDGANTKFDTDVLVVDGSNDKVGVNTASPSVSLEIAANDAILIPIGNTAQRPTGANGMIRYNSDDSKFESYVSGGWGTLADVGGSNTFVLINDSGFSNGTAGFTFDKSSNTISIGNSTVNTTVNSTSFSTGNTSITGAILSVGNTTVNTAINSTGITQNGLNFRVPKNYIVNPGMRISQENGTSSGTSSNYYPVDQWPFLHSQDGTLTFQQVSSATPGGSENRIRMTVTSADASIAAGQFALLLQHIEGLRTADLQWGTSNATDVVLRFGFKGPSGTYAVSIRNQDNTRSFVREFTISGGDANTDTLQTVTFPGDTSGTWDKDNTSSFQLIFTFAVGSTYQTTADAWQSGNYFGTSSTSNGIGTSSDVFEIFDVGMYADPDSTGLAPRFELPHYDTDLKECQRYYQEVRMSLRDYATTGSSFHEYGHGWLVQMRAAPAVSTKTAGSILNVTAVAYFNPYPTSVRFSVQSTSSGDMYAINYLAAANARL